MNGLGRLALSSPATRGRLAERPAGLGSADGATDRGEEGVPYHVVLRALIDCGSVADACASLLKMTRSSSANYLVADRDGVGLGLETAPGDFRRVYPLLPEEGVVLHTNHFLSPRFDGTEVSLWAMPDSAVRLLRCRVALETAARPLAFEDVVRMLSDHADHPNSICCHPDGRDHPLEQGATIASLIMDLDERTLWLADGNPCATPYRKLDYGEFLTGAASA